MSTENGQLRFDFNPPRHELPQLWTPDDIYLNCDQRTILAFSEDRRVERKRGEISQKDLADNLSMWANTQPHGGLMFIGVGKDGKILGLKHIETAHLNEIETVRRLCPDARYDLKRVAVTDHNGEANFVIRARVGETGLMVVGSLPTVRIHLVKRQMAGNVRDPARERMLRAAPWMHARGWGTERVLRQDHDNQGSLEIRSGRAGLPDIRKATTRCP